jgi:hypothetical protein
VSAVRKSALGQGQAETGRSDGMKCLRKTLGPNVRQRDREVQTMTWRATSYLVLFNTCCWGGEMGGACVEDRRNTEFDRKSRGRDTGDLVVDEMMMLKWILNTVWSWGLDSAGSGEGPVAGPCERSSNIKAGNFFTSWVAVGPLLVSSCWNPVWADVMFCTELSLMLL